MQGKHSFGTTMLIALALISVGLGVWFIVGWSNAGDNVPPKGTLLYTEGFIETLSKSKYDTTFTLSNNSNRFRVLSKMNGHHQIYKSLKNSKYKVAVLYADRKKDPVAGKAAYLVWEIKIGAELVKSYEQSKQAYINDDKLGLPLGIALIICGLYPLVISRQV